MGVYSTLWQVQASIASVALPILLFVIQIAKDEQSAAIKSHEVLIRETGIFPIIAAALAGTARVGIDVLWFSKHAVFVSDLLLFFGTLLFTITAYLTTLRLLFDPSRMRSRSLAVLREKMRESLDLSIAARLGNRFLFERLEQMGVGYWFSPQDRFEDAPFLVLRALSTGELEDIHLGRLEDFLQQLPRRTPPLTGATAGRVPTVSEVASDIRNPDLVVWFMKQYHGRITPTTTGVLRLRRSAFLELDQGALEARLQQCITVRPTDEI
jgi:hypothetical protein